MDTPMPPDLPERVRVLEALFERMDKRLSELSAEISAVNANLTARIEHLSGRIEHLNGRIEDPSGQIKDLPTTWQMITYTLGAQVTFAALLLGAYKLGH